MKEHKGYENRNEDLKRRTPMKRMALLILVFGLLLLYGRVEAVELTLLYSNDTRGVIDPCPT